MNPNESGSLADRLREQLEALTPDTWASIRSTIIRMEADKLLERLERPPSARGRLTYERVEALTRRVRMQIERSA